MRTLNRSFYFVPVVMLAASCGSSDKPVEPKLDLVPVTGIVTLDGKPLADADVGLFFDGEPPKGFISSGAKTDSSGKFVVMTGSKPGTVPGRYKITVSQLRLLDNSPIKLDPSKGIDFEQLRTAGQLKQLLPDRYSDPASTQLSAAVAGGDKNELKLELTSS